MNNTDKENSLEGLFEKTTEYFDTQVELAKLKAIKKAAIFSAHAIKKIILALFFLLSTFMLSIALGLWIGSLLGAAYLGFFALAFFYSIVVVVIYFNKNKWFVTPFVNEILKKINE